jgi:hypothetical protein
MSAFGPKEISNVARMNEKGFQGDINGNEVTRGPSAREPVCRSTDH